MMIKCKCPLEASVCFIRYWLELFNGFIDWDTSLPTMDMTLLTKASEWNSYNSGNDTITFSKYPPCTKVMFSRHPGRSTYIKAIKLSDRFFLIYNKWKNLTTSSCLHFLTLMPLICNKIHYLLFMLHSYWKFGALHEKLENPTCRIASPMNKSPESSAANYTNKEFTKIIY